MDAQKISQLETLLDRQLSDEEKERLRRIKDTLGIRDNDGMWEVVIAMEYQKKYYDELPRKIAAASTEILQKISETAESEARRAQGKLAENVAALAQKIAVQVNMATLLPMGLCALVCLLVYGSLTLWAGFRIGSGQTQPVPAHDALWVLRMPSGFLIGGLCLAGGLFLGVHAAKEFAEEEKQWKRRMLMALSMLVPGGAIFALAL